MTVCNNFDQNNDYFEVKKQLNILRVTILRTTVTGVAYANGHGGGRGMGFQALRAREVVPLDHSEGKIETI